MARARTTWGIGEYPRMALELEPAAGAAVHVAGIGPGVRVLDIATGTGTAALKAAELGAAVTALDIEPVLIEQAERRARSAGVDIRWLLGDFERLPVPDGSADVVLSIFGVMYAADHPAAARELARATAPGGRVVITSWQPGSVMPAMGQVLGGFLPPPLPSSGPPSRWGDPEALRNILEDTDLRLENMIPGHLMMTFADANEGALFLIDTAGHIISERDRLIRRGVWGDLQDGLANLLDHRGQRSDNGIDVRLDYLLATAVKPSRPR
jgi:SAM-dependent methyltransferase